MISPKEKAEELVEKILESLYDNGSLSFKRILYNKAKQCALIAVDEIIKSNPCYEDADRGGNFMWNDNTYYYQEVKQEIEKL